MDNIIFDLKKSGKNRTSETYQSTSNSFKRFRNDKDLTFAELNAQMIMSYESYLKDNGICLNSSSFYMRTFRAIYNKAVNYNLTKQQFPFKKVYTGIDKTIKRSVSLNTIRVIKSIDLSSDSSLDFARNMFLFSFYTRGMSFVDMAYLQKKDLKQGILSYHRRKTKQQLFIRWEKCMQDIVDKYDTSNSQYLLPIIDSHCNVDERKQYLRASQKVNYHLKKLGENISLQNSLTMYVARHSWASIAKGKNIPISVISDSLGHNSELTTQIYLSTIDNNVIDNTNSMIIKLL
ncbi:MAG: site-specific integrase [Bacteroidales bacterium]|nr:site-specific integrase [Bacteroidales bacterium]